MSENHSVCLLHYFLKEVDAYSPDVLEIILKYVYIDAILERNTSIIKSKKFEDIKNMKICKKIKEIEYGDVFIPYRNTYRTKMFLEKCHTNFRLTFSPSALYNPLFLQEINFKHTNITKLMDGVFKNCTAQTIYLPKNLKRIPRYCFENANIQTIIINKECESIESGAFRSCHKLQKIEIPENIKNIKFEAFFNCCKLNTVIFNQKKKAKLTIGTQSFHGCTNLKKNRFMFNVSVDVRYKSFRNKSNRMLKLLTKDIRRKGKVDGDSSNMIEKKN